MTTFTLMDHWFRMEAMAPATEPMLEGYTGLGFLVGTTHRVKLGLLVAGVIPPARPGLGAARSGRAARDALPGRRPPTGR